MTLPWDLAVVRSVALLRDNVPADGQPYFGAFSGGKDSVVIKELARRAGVPVEWHYHVTTIDPPELVRFIKREHPDVIFDLPKCGNFFAQMAKAGYPTRSRRWCCRVLKEHHPKGRALITGVRVSESARRGKQWTSCVVPDRITADPIVLPVRLWSESDIWAFIRFANIPYCSLYDEGFARLGCIGCPMISHDQREVQFARWPHFRRAWILAFERLWESRAGTLNRNGLIWWGTRYHDTADELWRWWHDGHRDVMQWRLSHGLRIKCSMPGEMVQLQLHDKTPVKAQEKERG